MRAQTGVPWLRKTVALLRPEIGDQPPLFLVVQGQPLVVVRGGRDQREQQDQRALPVLGERVHTVVAVRNPRLDAAALGPLCAARPANYKVAERFSFSDNPLPGSAYGKLLKRALSAEFIG